MQGTESEKVFEGLNLNPQLFVDEVINRIDDTVDGAFEFFQQEALKLVTEDESNELRTGISSICTVVQGALDKQMDLWEKYCLRHCFVVPEGFTLRKALDDQLNSVREKLHASGKESAELQKELHGLKLQNNLGQKFSEAVAEALQPYEQNSVHELFEEMLGATPTLHEKLAKMNAKRREEVERIGKEQSKGENFNALTYDSTGEQYMMQQQSKGFPAVDGYDNLYTIDDFCVCCQDSVVPASGNGRYFTTVDEPFKVLEAETVHEPPPPTEKLLVLGGNGFVGSNICKEALDRGLSVSSLSRSGRSNVNESWANNVVWHKGSLIYPACFIFITATGLYLKDKV
ncbi:hypothetical protein C5167_042770 [Papaver somniferum]|uniref:NAD-dependent epimerase/dehydratase domain-containing protein n=1 Tax=Papaver somniferum TaxID=3469 RepID=A0A4Y7L3R8_PAPSO|nr:hypothetical protein C5167_042770 [Papaver somniferum]